MNPPTVDFKRHHYLNSGSIADAGTSLYTFGFDQT
jgi:hypothetical protein